jgi:hypothetical protein
VSRFSPYSNKGQFVQHNFKLNRSAEVEGNTNDGGAQKFIGFGRGQPYKKMNMTTNEILEDLRESYSENGES